jgi:hypothetical protein
VKDHQRCRDEQDSPHNRDAPPANSDQLIILSDPSMSTDKSTS